MINLNNILCSLIQSITYIFITVYLSNNKVSECIKKPLFLGTFTVFCFIVGFLQRVSPGRIGVVLIIDWVLLALLLIINFNILIKDAMTSVLIGYIVLFIAEAIVLVISFLLKIKVAYNYPMTTTTTIVYLFVPIFSFLILKYIPILKFKNYIARFQFYLILLAAISAIMVTIFGILVKDYGFIPMYTNKFMLIILFFGIVMLIIEEMSERRRNERIHYYSTYLPIVEEMIKNVQMTQHSYNNCILSLSGLLDLDVSDSELKDAIRKITKTSDEEDETDYNFLHIDNKLLAGLLYQKTLSAKKKGINVNVEIRQYQYKSALCDMDIIDITGILIDNAIEHLDEGRNNIYISIGQPPDSDSDKYRIKVENPGPDVTKDFISHMFKKGITSKSNKEGHGFGMYILKSKVNKNNGKVIVSNTMRNGEKMLAVEVEV